MKKCCTCNVEKDYSNFGKHKGWPDGYRPQCKECRNVLLRNGLPNTGRFKKGNVPLKPFKKGHKEGMTGKKHTQETKDKIRQKKKGIILNPLARRNIKSIEWAKQIKERDEWKCKHCSRSDIKLDTHHIVPWKEAEYLRYDLNNGLTLCCSCHAKLEGFKIGHFSKGNIVSPDEKTRKKMSLAKKGSIPWNKGKITSEETKRKISETKKAKK